MSGTAGRFSIPTALISASTSTSDSPRSSRTTMRQLARASSHVADTTSVPNRTCGSTWCSFAHWAT